MAEVDGSSCVLRDLLLVPSATRNLISINRLCRDNNVCASFDAQKVRIHDLDTKKIVLEGGVRGGLYELPMRTKGSRGWINSCEKLDHFRWHCRLGHLNSKYMLNLEKKGIIKSNLKSVINCKSCQLGKSHAHPYPPRKSICKPMDLIFSDIWGPSPITSYQGYNYYVNFVDAGSSFNWVFLMVRKSDVRQIFERFRIWVERQCERKILAVQTDNAREYLKLGKRLAQLGISHRLSAPY